VADMKTADVRPKYDIRFPSEGRGVDQDQEWAEIGLNGSGKLTRFRFHDYDKLYAVPGLYEQLFYAELECQSPQVVTGLLGEVLASESLDPADLRVFDVGAGNGMVGEELDRMGAEHIVGVDIIPEAAEAAQRDRPGVYDDYFVVDLTDVPADDLTRLEDQRFNCLTTVAALGFGDIPPEAFTTAYNLVENGGLVAFNIKERFVTDGDRSGFENLISTALDDGTLDLEAQRRYRHRLAVSGDPLYYIAMVARKRADLPA